MKKNGFTLIELLIVVAIIAILAAIAVPNFLEAQVRSKTSRAVADLRTFATALEAYAVDNNHYAVPFPNVRQGAANNLTGTNVPNELSTPIGYISSSQNIEDPFSVRYRGRYSGRYNRYGYLTEDVKNHTRWYNTPPTGLTEENRIRSGKWRLDSFGPDEKSELYPNELSYDSTNGTVSRGDIYRSQRDTTGKQN